MLCQINAVFRLSVVTYHLSIINTETVEFLRQEQNKAHDIRREVAGPPLRSEEGGTTNPQSPKCDFGYLWQHVVELLEFLAESAEGQDVLCTFFRGLHLPPQGLVSPW